MNGEQHRAATSAGIVVHSVGAALLKANGHPEALGAVVGSVIPLFCTPDLDQEQHKTADEQLVYAINPVLGKLWQQYWMGYALAMPHRHILSHNVPFGTLIRIAYLFAPYFLYTLSVFQPAIVAAYAVTYYALPRILWVREGNPYYRAIWLVAPLVIAYGSGAFQPTLELWMLYAVGAWMLQDFYHLALDGFRTHG